MKINIFHKYTPEEACVLIGCNMKTLLPILKEMSKKKCGVKKKRDTYNILGGEIKVIKYKLEHTYTYGISGGKVKVIKYSLEDK